MTIRTDIALAWHRSPRTATIADPSTSINVQDAHDTLGNLEDSEVGNLHPDLITSAGKEDLGGGVEVGITSTLQDAQLMFDARTTPASTASVTTQDTNGETLIDTAGTFVADGVDRGYLIINFTDQSMATVLDVIGEGELNCTALEGGTDNQFDISDDVKLFKVWEVEIAGGNVVAVDDVGDPLTVILPSFGIMAVRTSASSATTQNQEALEHELYGGGVTIDVVSGVAGTTGLIGTPQTPSNNTPDAVTIAAGRGLGALYIKGDITFDTGDDIRSLSVHGESTSKTTVTANTGSLTLGTEFYECTLQGTLDGTSLIDHCHILTLVSVEAEIRHCILHETITLSGSGTTDILDSWSGVPGTDTPVIDYGGSGRDLGIRSYSGGIKIINKTGPENVSIDMISGHAVLDSTITDGVVVIRGADQVTDNSTGTAEVIVPNRYPFDALARLIESQRGHHTAAGNVFYWDPANGDDADNGLSKDTAKLTWGGGSGVNSLVTAYAHDVVMLVPGEVAGVTVITEQITMDKEFTFLRGPGRDILFLPTATTGVTVAVSATGCEIGGVRINTAATGDGEALEVSGADFAYIHDIWIDQCRGDGIRLLNVSYAKLKDIHVQNCVGDAVVFRGITQDCKYNVLSDATLLNNAGNGVLFDGVKCQYNYVWGGEEGVTIRASGGWGVLEQGTADFNHVVGPVVHLHDNTLGDHQFIGAGSGAENVVQWLHADQVMEGSFTFVQLVRMMASVLFGKSSGGGTTNIKFRDMEDTKDRIDEIVDASGNRTSVTKDGT